MKGVSMAWSGSKVRAVVLDVLERAGWSAGQVFFATLLAGGTAVSVGNLPWKYSSTLALSAAVSSIVLTIVQYLARITDLPFWPDQILRLVKTFAASLAASIVAAKVFDVTSFDWTSALNVAFLATVTALGKGLLARGQAITGQTTGEKKSPSTLPTQTYEDAVSRTKKA